MADEILFGEDYHTRFDPKDYLVRFAGVNVPYKVAPLKALYEFYESYSAEVGRPLSVCDIGCGPVIAYVISAARFASDIVLSEYTELNRDEINLWIRKEPNAHDWTPFFAHIVQNIEGRDETEVDQRADLLRSKIKAVVGSDFMKPQMMDNEYMCQYDVVQIFLSMEQSSGSEEDYRSTLKKMFHLVKPGGKFVLYSQQKDKILQPAIYHVKKAQFQFLRVSFDFVLQSLKDAGYSSVKSISMDDKIPPCDCKDGFCSFTLFIATR